MNREPENRSLDSVLHPLQRSVEPLEKGQNVLFEFGDTVSLLKYEGAQIGSSDPLVHRANRHTNIVCMGNILMPRENDPYIHKDPAKRIIEKARAEFLGTHRIDFTFDKEFGIYLPSADSHTDLHLDLARKYADGRVEKNYDVVNIVADGSLIVKRLKEITRPGYFDTNVVPFLESRPTGLRMPKWKTNESLANGLKNLIFEKNRPKYVRFDMSEAYRWFTEATKDMERGSFVYVGGKEEVYMLGLAKDGYGDHICKEHISQAQNLCFSSRIIISAI